MRSEVAQRADFGFIRYAQCWEDADLLLAALNPGPGEVCLSIASAGDNTLALLSRSPARVIALDLSEAQLHCLRLRVAAYQLLTHEELLQLMGSRPCDHRVALFAKCRKALDPTCCRFWESRLAEVAALGIGGVGKFERYFQQFRTRVLPLVHSRQTVASLFTPRSREEREAFYRDHWNTWRWRGLVALFFSRFVMARLGRDPAFFDHAQGSLAAQVAQRTAHALQLLDPTDNPYLHWILTGHHGTALPLALRPEHFATIRENLPRLEIRCQSVESFAASGERVHAFNLSDIFEYISFPGFVTLYARLLDTAHPGARLAYWNMMVPRQAPRELAGRLQANQELAQSLFERDRAFFYRAFVLETVS